MSLRWQDYVMARNEEAHRLLASSVDNTLRPATIICGAGADPRSSTLLDEMLQRNPRLEFRLLSIEPPVAVDAAGVESLRAATASAVERASSRSIEHIRVSASVAEFRASGLAVLRKLYSIPGFPFEGPVIVDISGLPSAIYFPLIGGLLRNMEGGRVHDLLVAVHHNPALDAEIVEEGATDPGTIHGFPGSLSTDPASDQVRIWTPVVGAGQLPQLLAINDALIPSDICPVLPMPAGTLRRADDLVLEYRSFLFEVVQVESSNIVYASEGNPFDLYRSLWRLSARYQRSFNAVGDIAQVVSLHSSKLLSIGALLAAYERGLAVYCTCPTAYLIPDVSKATSIARASELVVCWIGGAPYMASARE